MEADAAVPEREPIIVREISIVGDSRLVRYHQLRASLLAALREEGLLHENGSYLGMGIGREGARLYCAIQVVITGETYRGEAPCHKSEPVLMEVHKVV